MDTQQEDLAKGRDTYTNLSSILTGERDLKRVESKSGSAIYPRWILYSILQKIQFDRGGCEWGENDVTRSACALSRRNEARVVFKRVIGGEEVKVFNRVLNSDHKERSD